MTLPEILKAVRQWWWILVICPVIAAGTAYFVSSSITPTYEAEATAIVEHQLPTGANDLQSIQAAERRTQTFTQLVSSRSVLERVIDALDLEESVEDLRDNISVEQAGETQLVHLSVEDEDPERAATIANTTVEQFGEYVREIQAPAVGGPEADFAQAIDNVQAQMAETQAIVDDLEGRAALSLNEQEQLEQAQTLLTQLQQAEQVLLNVDGAVAGTEQAGGSQIFVVEEAAASSEPVSPRTTLNTALAGILGVLLGGGLVLGVAWLDDNVKTEQDVRGVLERPLIGTVPQERLPAQMESIHNERSISGEIFRGLRTNLQFTMVDRNVRSIVVTSASPGEGKTTIASNLAIVLAQGGQRVLLVDADLRRPMLHNLFHRVRNDRGLSNLLLQSPAVIENVVQPTAINNLRVLTSGPIPPNPPDLFGSARMRALVNALEESADIVIFDSPPVAISESLLLTNLADGALFVVRAGKLRTGELVQGVESVSQTGVPILGVVLNGVKRTSQSAHRIYQQYYPPAAEEAELATNGRRSWISRVFGRSA